MRLKLVALVLAVALPAHGQSYEPPRTPSGKPDFTGQWSNAWLTPLEKTGGVYSNLSVTPEQAKIIVGAAKQMAKAIGDIANDPEAADPDAHALTVVRGEHRTRQIVQPEDGMLPYTPDGLRQVAAQQMSFLRLMAGRGEGPEERLIWERCLAGMGQAPLMYAWSINGNRRFVQTNDALVIHSEAGGDTRIIRMGGERPKTPFGSFTGDSIGRWEGDTLVVETTGFRPDDRFRIFVTGRPMIVSTEAKVIERFTRVGADELNYQFTVEDPKIYAKPWLAEYSLVTATQPMYEFACHEGNYGLENILKGQREIERRAAAKPK